MSIASKLATIQSDVADIGEAIADKGVAVPAGAGTSDFAGLIAQIEAGGLPEGVKVAAQTFSAKQMKNISSSSSSSYVSISLIISASVSVQYPNAELIGAFYFTTYYYERNTSSTSPTWYSASYVSPYQKQNSSESMICTKITPTVTRTDTETTFAIPAKTIYSGTVIRPSSGTSYGRVRGGITLIVLYKEPTA